MHLVVQATWGPSDPTRATVPFLHAKAAREQGDTVTVMLFHDAAALAVPGVADGVKACGPPEVAPVVEQLVADEGVELLVCRPCAEIRGYGEERLRPGFRMATIGEFHAAIRKDPSNTVVGGF